MNNAPDLVQRPMDAIYRRYAVVAMLSIHTASLVDQGLIGLLMQPIKVDLQLSDTQLGIVTGIGFGVLYAVLGVPIARWADRGNRITIASIFIGLWGLTVMACLMVTNYIQLLFARMAAAAGGAGCKPATLSLVGDYYPVAADRVRAMAIYWLGGPLAALISRMVGGWLSERYGWRATFFLMGIPGLVLAALIKSTLVEPRSQMHTTRIQYRRLPPFRQVVSLLWRTRSCRQLIAALTLILAMTYGLDRWNATFMMRSHGLGTQELGIWLGAIYGFGGSAGVFFGGYVAGRWFANDEKGQMRISAIALALATLCCIIFLMVHQPHVALIMLIPIMLALNFIVPPAFTLIQRLVPDESRATCMAITMLLYNLIGMGFAPLVVGSLSDWLAPEFGTDSLRYAMLITTVVGLWAAYHLWQVGHTVQQDLVLDRRELTISHATPREGL